VGISILSGSHLQLVPEVVRGLREQGLEDVPVVVGGIVPPADAARLAELGVAAVFTPRDFELSEILGGVVAVIRRAHGLPSRPREGS
jgi:(2R)-ethylmalonyl-CoA mutase